jgi:hypothetical protein
MRIGVLQGAGSPACLVVWNYFDAFLHIPLIQISKQIRNIPIVLAARHIVMPQSANVTIQDWPLKYDA